MLRLTGLVALLGQLGGARGLQCTPNDLFIGGCGTLGKMAAAEWKRKFPEALVVGETLSDTRHADLEAQGVVPSLREDREGLMERRGGRKFPFVLFCAAPSGSGERYPEEVAQCVDDCWAADNEAGTCVFTSSGAVYAEESGGVVNEGSALTDTPRAMRLLNAESSVLERGGCVIRLAGLYTRERGAHSFWLKQTELSSDGSGIVNLLHYEDAAGAAVAALLAKAGSKKQVWLAADDEPLTREQICAAALQCETYHDCEAPTFIGEGGPKGKVYDTSATRAALSWTPRIPSFSAFMKSP